MEVEVSYSPMERPQFPATAASAPDPLTTRPSKMGVYHRDSYGTICLPGHMERFEQKEKKRTQKKD